MLENTGYPPSIPDAKVIVVLRRDKHLPRPTKYEAYADEVDWSIHNSPDDIVLWDYR